MKLKTDETKLFDTPSRILLTMSMVIGPKERFNRIVGRYLLSLGLSDILIHQDPSPLRAKRAFSVTPLTTSALLTYTKLTS